jgi:hypothetical protein
VTDVGELIVADHERIGRLFGALDDAARYAAGGDGGRGGPDWMLAAIWVRIATLLGLHADAEQEICFMAMFSRRDRHSELEDAIGDLNDLRDAVAETRLHDVGSPAWWRAVNAARRSICDHISAIEQGALAEFRDRSEPQFRRHLGNQWKGFIAARHRDGLLQDWSRPPGPPRSDAAAHPGRSAVGWAQA